jgi:hypothetical protein
VRQPFAGRIPVAVAEPSGSFHYPVAVARTEPVTEPDARALSITVAVAGAGAPHAGPGPFSFTGSSARSSAHADTGAFAHDERAFPANGSIA